MMRNKKIPALDPAAMSAFVATLAALPAEEIEKAKRLYVLNAIADFNAMKASFKGMVITFGLLSIIPPFIIVFIPSFISYRATVKAGRQKIINAIEVWREDLGGEYHKILSQLE